MKRLLIIFLVSITFLHALHFNLKYTMTDGPLDPYTVVRMADIDCDTKNELLFTSDSLFMPSIYEFNDGVFKLVHFIPDDQMDFWGVGDFDRDGLIDLLIKRYYQGDSVPRFFYF